MWNYIIKLTSRRLFYPVIILLIIFFTAMRIVCINADAPQDLTISASIHTDEGFKIYGSRNYVLFGDWKWTPEDEYEAWVKRSPLNAWSYEWIFRNFGISFLTIRSLSIFYAALTMIVMFIFIVRNFGRLTGIIALILFGTNFFTTMFNRLGFYETHLIFFVMLSLLGFSEAFRRNQNILLKFFFFLLGITGFIAGFYIKRSLFIVVASIIPALLIYFCYSREKTRKFINGVFISILGIIILTYLLLSNSIAIQKYLVYALLSTQIFGQSLSAFLPVFAFEPLHIILGKGLYLEFIFLHPFTFLTGMLYSLYTFYQFIFKERRNLIDLFLSSWLLFGFILLSIMYYHPARYYLLLILPLVVLASRAIVDFKNLNIISFLSEKKPFPHNLLVKILLLFAVIYTGVVFMVQIIPFAFRRYLIDILNPAFVSGDIFSVIHIIALFLLLEIVLITITLINWKRIRELVSKPKFQSLLFIIILTLQIFQYGKWFIFHENRLFNLSREMGRELPEDSIIAGSWSAGMVIENNLKSIVFQSYIPSNHNLLKKLIYNIEIPVYTVSNGIGKRDNRKNFPLYLAVCRNVIFEKSITRLYSDHIIPDNLIKKRFSSDILKLRFSK